MLSRTQEDFRLRELCLIVAHDWLVIYEWCACTKQVVTIYNYVRPIVEEFRSEILCGCEDCILIATEGIQAKLEAIEELLFSGLHRVGASLDPTFHQGPWHDN